MTSGSLHVRQHVILMSNIFLSYSCYPPSCHSQFSSKGSSQSHHLLIVLLFASNSQNASHVTCDVKQQSLTQSRVFKESTRLNALTENDCAILETRMTSRDDPNYPHTTTHLFTQNYLVDTFNMQCIANLTTEKVKVQAFDTVHTDVSTSIKAKLLNSLPRKQSDTANLAIEVELAVGMKYDLTNNIDVTDGLINGSSCELKVIENKQKEKTSKPSSVG